MKKVIIIGAGIAGMTAAMKLINSGFTVEIFEQSNKIGGRCFSFFDKINHKKIAKNSAKINEKLFEIDNGQHLFSNAYNEFFELIKWLGNEKYSCKNENLKVDFIELNSEIGNSKYQLNCNKFNGLKSFAYGLMKMKKIKISDKILCVNILFKILFNHKFQKDISTLEFFKKIGFSDQIIEKLWKPMVVAILNSPIEKASTKLFINTLRKMISIKNQGISLLYSKVPLSNIFNNFLEKINNFENKTLSENKIFFNSTVKELIVENGICVGIVKKNAEKIFADHVISTVQPKQLSKIHPFFANFRNIFSSSPIISIYLWLNKPLIRGKYIACINSNIEWIFNKNELLELPNFGNLHQISLTVSAAEMNSKNNLILLDDEKLLAIILEEIRQISNDFTVEILAYRIIKDKNATSLITFENNHLRPTTVTKIQNFYLAGDWIQTNLPATIESAALSGKLAAEMIINCENLNKKAN